MPPGNAIAVEEQLAILDELIASLDASIKLKEQELAAAERTLKIKMVKIGALEAAGLPILSHLAENEATVELTIQRLKTGLDEARQVLDAYDDQRGRLLRERAA